MTLMEALRELLWTVWDMLQTGDPLGHALAWWEVVTGQVGPDSPAGRPTAAGEAALAGTATEATHDLLAKV